MNKINFKNLPDRSTPLSAEMLNQLQTNFEAEIHELISTTILSTPLTNSNLELTDANIVKAKLIVVYFTHDRSGNGYRNSVIIPIEPVRQGASDTEWYVVHSVDSKAGYVKVNLNDNQLLISQYSDNDFAVLGYTLIS